ncbi:YecA family protein [Enterovibrio norvegicus]|uniref:YecA family protein n=1 Tax=Enterovibrio norvegicus TaxID=188144 RepID=UPI00352DE72C
MKIGRNDPCPCGSGEKYKRCCSNTTSGAREDVQDEIAQITAMNPNLTIDELNLALQSKMKQRNNQPLDAFCGLTPTQMSNWLYAPFGTVKEVTISSPNTLNASPVMRYLELIIENILASNGALKATSKGNLPTKLVKQASELLPEFSVEKYNRNISISEFAGSNEDKFNALHYTRILAEIAGIIVRQKGHFTLRASAKKEYEKDGLAALYPRMLNVAVSQFNWAYFDGWQADLRLEQFWLFMLWRLKTHGDFPHMIDDVATAFPDLLLQIEEDPYLSPKDKLGRIVETRFVERFLEYFGFVVLDPRRVSPEGTKISPKITLLPLLEHTFHFKV